MAKEKKMVEAITSMDEDFAQWYTDIVKKAELSDYSSVSNRLDMRSGRISAMNWTSALRQPA